MVLSGGQDCVSSSRIFLFFVLIFVNLGWKLTKNEELELFGVSGMSGQLVDIGFFKGVFCHKFAKISKTLQF